MGGAPRRNHEYVPQKVQIQAWLKRLISLPCDVLVTGHLYGVYEPVKMADGELEDRLVKYRFLSTGKATVVIPLEFSEMWVLVTTPTSGGEKREIIMGYDGMYAGSTRLGNRGKFAMREAPDIKALLKKAGWPTIDKAKLY